MDLRDYTKAGGPRRCNEPLAVYVQRCNFLVVVLLRLAVPQLTIETVRYGSECIRSVTTKNARLNRTGACHCRRALLPHRLRRSK